MKKLLFAFALLLLLTPVRAEDESTSVTPDKPKILTEVVEYNDGNTVLEGFLAYRDQDADQPRARSGVLIVHQWKGIGDYEKMRARQLAELGYVAFCADIYGKGVRPTDPKEAGKTAGMYKNDRALLRHRAQAGLDYLKSKLLDTDKIAAIGYCFGGTTVLELARNGADIAGVVSFHGGLDAPAPAKPGDVKCKVMVLHGAVDPHVPPAQVEAFKKEMKDAGVDMRFEAYEGAVHSFTDKGAGDDPSKGAAYNADADKKSWETMKKFFAEIFK